jgi:hypothetical protein
MEKWLEIPEDRKCLPVGRLCLIMALSVLMLFAFYGRKGHAEAQSVPLMICQPTI